MVWGISFISATPRTTMLAVLLAKGVVNCGKILLARGKAEDVMRKKWRFVVTISQYLDKPFISNFISI